MSPKSLIAMISVFILSSCASVNKAPLVLELPKHRLVGVYEFVSLDLSICGKYGNLPVDGIVRFDDDAVHFDFTDPVLGEDKVKFDSPLVVKEDNITFQMFGNELNGKFHFERRNNGYYLIMTFKPFPDEQGTNWVFKRK